MNRMKRSDTWLEEIELLYNWYLSSFSKHSSKNQRMKEENSVKIIG